MSESHKQFIRAIRKRKWAVFIAQILLFVFFVGLWEISARSGIIDPFIFSQPSRIWSTTIGLIKDGTLLLHTGVTFFETVASFFIGSVLGLLLAILLWSSEFCARVLDPYLVLLNALPKTALGPIILVWVGGTTKSIIVMALLVSIIITIMSIYTSFVNTDEDKIKLLKTFGANRRQILTKVVLPANVASIISVLKINVGLSLVGVIVGEFLVSKAGLGYLIIYGGQVFKMDLVMTSIIVLSIVAAFLYFIVAYIEKKVTIS